MFELPPISEFIRVFWLYIIKPFWWLWAICLGIILIKLGFTYLLKWIEERKRIRWLKEHKTLEEFKTLDPREFEKIVAVIFKNLGYKAQLKGGPKDRGIDIGIIKDKKRYFVQCKKMDVVSPKFIREFYGSIVDNLREGEKGFLVTTGEFTEEGREFAKDKPIELVDGSKLEKVANQKILDCLLLG